MKTYVFVLSCIALMLVFSCGTDQENESSADLLTNAIEFKGEYPDPSVVAYTDNGKTLEIQAYPGQVTTFFKTNVSDEDATTIITGFGGIVLSKIPSVGYYLIKINKSETNAFINDIQSDSRVDFAIPNILVYLSSDAYVLDGCGSGITAGENHSATVIKNLQDCNGAFESCSNILSEKGNVLEDLLLHGIIKSIQNSGKSNALINVSAAAGLNDGSWAKQSPKDREASAISWYYFMRNILTIISGLDEDHRSRLIVTVASGNGDMPITEMMNQLRVNPMYSKILSQNILIVSNKTDSLDINHGNYSKSDPDVVVLDNPDARLGTSFASPCALGIMQDLMSSKGGSAIEVLTAVKLASSINAGRYVKSSEAMDVLNKTIAHTQYKGGSFTLPFEIANQQCVAMLAFNTAPVIYWNGSQGSMFSITNSDVSLVSGTNCYLVGVTNNTQTFQFNLTGSNSNITGQGTATFLIGKGSVPVVASFNGAINIAGDISGTLSLTPTGIGAQSKIITLFKQ